LAALHSSGPAAAHGALSADRIVFTPEGRLCLVEHPLGAALQRLGQSPAALWHEFGLLTIGDERGLARIDARNDVVQLGTVALSMLLGRTITLTDFQQNLPVMLDEFSAMAAASPSAFAAPLRVWLEHALQLSPHPYRSAADAQEGLKELPASSVSPSAIAVATAGFLEAFPQQLRETDLTEHSATARLEVARPLRPQHVGQLTNRWGIAEVIGDKRDVVDSAPEIGTTPEIGVAPDRARRRNFVGAWIAIAL